jgi:hypothetical protein
MSRCSLQGTLAGAIARTQGCGSLYLPETQRLTSFRESVDSQPDGRTLRVIWCAITGLFRSRAASQAEILVLRHQLDLLRRRSLATGPWQSRSPGILRIYSLSPTVLNALNILQPSEPPRYIIRDRDGAYGEAFIRRLTAMGIRDRPIDPLAKWTRGEG